VIFGINKALPGWTVLIHTGDYPISPPLIITKALTLKAEDGPVIIGQ
jgi:hypothetical protein